MAVKIIDGDLFTTEAMYICHQVNCQGRMGSGVAKIVREKFPEAFEEYKKMCDRGAYLGLTQYVRSNGKVIINMFAQDRYGFDGSRFSLKTESGMNVLPPKDGSRYTDYNAFLECLIEIHSAIPDGRTIAMPYKIGCGLGGGDWEIIYDMIAGELGQDYTVELWRLK